MEQINLRPYQEQSIEALRENIRQGVKRQVLSAPTGSGKTIIGTALIAKAHEKYQRAIFLCDRISLIDQTSATLSRFGIPHGVMQAAHEKTDVRERIQVASIQTLARRGWPDASLIIVDECHTVQKETIARIMQDNVIVVGLTATPFTKGLGKYYDSVVSVTTTNRLTDDGHLVGFRCFAPTEPDMKGAKTVAGEWTDREAETRSMPIVGDAVAEYIKHGDGKKFIAFGCTVAHCQEMKRHFIAAGVNCELYTYREADLERSIIVDEFRRPDSSIRGLISVAALAKGFDVPDVGVIIMARPLKSSLAEHIQILGRGLRPHPGKESCLILDLAGNMMRFWAPMQEFFAIGSHCLDDGKPKIKATPKVAAEDVGIKCPNCRAVHKKAPACPACGHVYPSRSNVVHVDGALIEIAGSRPDVKIPDKQSWYSQLVSYQQWKGYQKGWAAHKYRAKFGVWPRNLRDVPEPISLEVSSWIRSQQIRYSRARA